MIGEHFVVGRFCAIHCKWLSLWLENWISIAENHAVIKDQSSNTYQTPTDETDVEIESVILSYNNYIHDFTETYFEYNVEIME